VEAPATHLSRSLKLHPMPQAEGNWVIAAVKSTVDVNLLPEQDKWPRVDVRRNNGKIKRRRSQAANY
jgi:hypothetical protein